MTREHKLALIVGFSLVLVLGVLLSDHLSAGKTAPAVMSAQAGKATDFGAGTPVARLPRTELPPVNTASTAGSSTSGTTTTSAINGILDSIGRTEAIAGVREESVRGTPLPLPVQPPVATNIQNPLGLPVSHEPVRRHDVTDGDRIYRIATDTYGDGNLWVKIREYPGNKGKIGDKGEMREGVTLLLPPKDVLLGKAVLGDDRVGQGNNTQSKQSGGTGTEIVMGQPKPGAVNPAKPENKIDNKIDSKPETKTTSYTVKDGDTLASIARKRLGSAVKVQEILSLNKGVLSDPDDLKIGMVLKLPSR